MNRTHVVGLLGAVVTAFLAVAACSESNTTNPVKPAVDAGSDTSKPGTDTGVVDEDTGAGGETSGETGGGGCAADPKVTGTIKDIRDPASAKKALVNDVVKIEGAVVTSIKWRTQTPNDASDPCVFSIFVADPNATFAPWSGIQIIAYGAKPVALDGGRFTCDQDKDPIPVDIKVGDTVDIKGVYTEFGASAASCGKATPPLPPPSPEKMPQIRACTVSKTGTGTVPAAAAVAPAKIANGSTELLQWAGGRMKIGPVTAGSDPAFGAFTIEGSTLAVNNDIYYRGAATQATVKKGDAFEEIVGLSVLDFCTWSLAPTQCTDMKPAAGSAAKCPTPSGGDAGGSDAAGD